MTYLHYDNKFYEKTQNHTLSVVDQYHEKKEYKLNDYGLVSYSESESYHLNLVLDIIANPTLKDFIKQELSDLDEEEKAEFNIIACYCYFSQFNLIYESYKKDIENTILDNQSEYRDMIIYKPPLNEVDFIRNALDFAVKTIISEMEE